MSTTGGGEGELATPSDLRTSCRGCVLISMVLLVVELELLASLELFMLRKEPFSVGDARVLRLPLLMCFVGSPAVFTTVAASFSSVRLCTCVYVVCVCVCTYVCLYTVHILCIQCTCVHKQEKGNSDIFRNASLKTSTTCTTFL